MNHFGPYKQKLWNRNILSQSICQSYGLRPLISQTSSLIQTILSAPESHRIMPFGSRALPPVGTCTLPWRSIYFLSWIITHS